MANENMIKFLRGNVANLPQTATSGALYFTKDEGIYLGMEDGSYHRYGDFITVADVNSLPASGAHATCMYYCTAENILARYDSAKGWIQINKQPTAEEMKTILGLGSMAYKSQVAEADLTAELAEKVNAAAEGNHAHSNKTVLDGITAEKVAAWDAAEGNAKGHADGLNTAMNTRVEALEAIDHEHANKALLDTYTQTEANLADAVAKKHSHTFVESELNKIADGDVAKWNAVVADHLTSDDKTALENSIKEAKKAGTDANTNIETYKVANDARVLAVEEDIAEITGDNGILAQAKSYTDGKDSAMNTRVAALETAAPTHALKTEVEAVDAKFANYNTTVAQKAIDDAQDAEIAKKVAKTDYEADKATFATKTELNGVDSKFANYKTAADQKLIDDAQDVEIAKKVDKVEGKDLIATSEIERLATLHNYDDTQVKADIAKKADAEAMTTELGKKVDKVDGYSLVSDTEIARLADVDNYDDEEVRGLIGDNAKAIGDLEAYVGTIPAGATATDIVGYVQEKTAGIATEGAMTELGNRVTAVEGDVATIKGDYLKAADIADFETKENVKKVADDLAAYVESNNAAVALKADKSALEATDKTLADVKTVVDNFFADDAAINDTIDTLKEIANYIATDKEGAADITARVGALEGKVDVEKVSEAIDADVSAAIEAEVARANGAYDAKGAAADAQAAAEATAAGALASARTEITAEIGAAISGEVSRADGKYEEKGVAQGIVDALKLSETYEPIGAEGRAIAAAEGKVNALAGNVYTKEQTYTQAEVDALIQQAHTWGEF